MEGLKTLYKSRREIEMFVNSWSLTSLLKDFDKLDYSKSYIDEFAKAIQYFWQLRFNFLFPDKDIAVEIGNQILGEDGISVTAYQK